MGWTENERQSGVRSKGTMMKACFAGILATGLAASAWGQNLLLYNGSNAGDRYATTNGRVFLRNGTIFDGLNYNLGVNVYGGPAPDTLGFMGTYTAATDPKGYTGLDAGTFALGPFGTAVNVPGVAYGGTAYIRLQMWFDGSGGLFPSYEAARNGGCDGYTAEVLFANPVSNPYGSPPTPPPPLSGMPSVVLFGPLTLAPPTLSQQPQSLTVLQGGTATFSVVRNLPGACPITQFQWRFNGTNIGVATRSYSGSALVITNVQTTHAGNYSVLVSNDVGTATSSNVTLTVVNPVRITAQPQGTVGYWGSMAQFVVAAEGTPPLAYLWYEDGLPIARATNAVLTLTNLDDASAGSYSVVVTNLYSTTNSAAALLIVNPPGVGLGLHPFLTITGTVGKHLGVEYRAQVAETNSWINPTNLTLTAPVQEWIDTSVDAVVASRRFYRVVPIP